MQSALRLIYPTQCLACETLVEGAFGLCAGCWGDITFIDGAACLTCGVPLLGEAPGDEAALCDECIVTPRPWETGAAELLYDRIGRRLVLALKHGDRHDLVAPMARWMVSRLRAGTGSGDMVVPVPAHWTRLLRRRYNQSALLARAVAQLTGATWCADALVRVRATKPQEGMSFADRFAMQAGAIVPHPRRGQRLSGRRVLIVDDVMTSGATLASAAGAAARAGAARVDTVTLARVAKDF